MGANTALRTWHWGNSKVDTQEAEGAELGSMRLGLQGREVLRAPSRLRLRQLGGDVGPNKGANVFEREK